MREFTGILTLDGTRIAGAGSVFDEVLICSATQVRVVPGATTAAVVEAPASIETAFVAQALSLRAMGCDLITSNCGLSASFQRAVVEATGLPTVLSSLLLVPLLWRVFGGGLGILTYAQAALDGDAVRWSCGWTDEVVPVLGEVRQFPSWRALEGDEPLDAERMLIDLVTTVEGVIARGGNRVLLIECTAMLPFVDEIRSRVSTPVFSIFDLLACIRRGLRHGD